MVLFTFHNQCRGRKWWKPGARSFGYPSLLAFGLAPALEQLAACFRVWVFQLEEGSHVSTHEAGKWLVVKCWEFFRQMTPKWGRVALKVPLDTAARMRSVFRADHPLSLTAGLLSDHLGAYLHTGARFISTHIEKFTKSMIISSLGHFKRTIKRHWGTIWSTTGKRRIWGVFEDWITLGDYLEDSENEALREATGRPQLQESCLSKQSGGPQCPV